MMKKFVVCLALAGAVLSTNTVQALPFTNDFTSPNWQVANGSTSQFNVLAGNIGQLTTVSSNTPLTLSQTFDYDPSFSLNFGILWIPSNNGSAYISVDLVDYTNGGISVLDPFTPLLATDGSDILNRRQFALLLDPSLYDFSSTTQLQLTYTIYDFDDAPDQLQIDFNSGTAPVPEPSTIVLIATGLFGAGFTRLRRNKK
jgi:hypothetical protein